jgi:hypothetical protein
MKFSLCASNFLLMCVESLFSFQEIMQMLSLNRVVMYSTEPSIKVQFLCDLLLYSYMLILYYFFTFLNSFRIILDFN